MTTPIFSPGIGRVVVSPIDDAENSVSTIFVYQWNVIDRISVGLGTTWRILAQGISTQQASAFNVRKRMHVIGNIVKYGIGHPTVWPIDESVFIPAISWNVDKRATVTKSSAWNVSARKSSSHKMAFNAYATLHAHSDMQWRVLFKVRKPGFIVETWVNQISQLVSHPVDLADYQTQPFSQFNVARRLSIKKAIRFSTHVKTTTRGIFLFNTNGIVVTCQMPSTWETMMRL